MHGLHEDGYAGLTIESIAARASVHKTTIYRRWQSKDAVVAAAVADLVSQQFPVQASGSLVNDLRYFARTLVRLLNSRSPRVRGVLHAFFSEASTLPEIATLKRDFFAGRYAQAEAIVSAAGERHDIAIDIDAGELIGLVVAPIYYRLLVSGEPITNAVADRAVDNALAALRGGGCQSNTPNSGAAQRN
nr:TetR/AcrR family transcriptional regulator [Flexivirga meconopsidis]